MIGNQARIAVLAMVAALLGGTVGSTLVSIPSSASLGQAFPTELPPPRTGISPINFTFYGNSVRGWGFSNATITEPGPNITVYFGDVLNLTLIAHDSAPHNWFIDYNNDVIVSPGEPASPDFNSPVGTIVVWPFIADQTGNWTYRCHIHPTSMTGSVSIIGGPPPQLPRGALPLITGIMIGALSVVLVFAVVYHVRAVRAAKRMR